MSGWCRRRNRPSQRDRERQHESDRREAWDHYGRAINNAWANRDFHAAMGPNPTAQQQAEYNRRMQEQYVNMMNYANAQNRADANPLRGQRVFEEGFQEREAIRQAALAGMAGAGGGGPRMMAYGVGFDPMMAQQTGGGGPGMYSMMGGGPMDPMMAQQMGVGMMDPMMAQQMGARIMDPMMAQQMGGTMDPYIVQQIMMDPSVGAFYAGHYGMGPGSGPEYSGFGPY